MRFGATGFSLLGTCNTIPVTLNFMNLFLSDRANIIAFLRRSHLRGKHKFRSHEEIMKATGLSHGDVVVAIWIGPSENLTKGTHSRERRKGKYVIQRLHESKWLYRLRKKYQRTFWQRLFNRPYPEPQKPNENQVYPPIQTSTPPETG